MLLAATWLSCMALLVELLPPMTSPAAKICLADVCRLSFTVMPFFVYSTPAFSRPRSTAGVLPVAISTSSTLTNFSWPPLRKVTSLCMLSRLMATTRELVRTFMPWFLSRAWPITCPTSSSSRGRRRDAISAISTFVPSSAKNWAISTPVDPPPTIKMLLTGWWMSRRLLGVRCLTFSRFLISGLIGTAPLAIRYFLLVMFFLLTLIS